MLFYSTVTFGMEVDFMLCGFRLIWFCEQLSIYVYIVLRFTLTVIIVSHFWYKELYMAKCDFKK